jgi:hypothetical protein
MRRDRTAVAVETTRTVATDNVIQSTIADHTRRGYPFLSIRRHESAGRSWLRTPPGSMGTPVARPR